MSLRDRRQIPKHRPPRLPLSPTNGSTISECLNDLSEKKALRDPGACILTSYICLTADLDAVRTTEVTRVAV